MIRPGDRIALGLSGGKDSMTALYTLAMLRKILPQPFSVLAITVDLGWPESDWSAIAGYCEKLDVPHQLISTKISSVIFQHRQEANPCSLCAKMRRGALNDAAVATGCNVVALGHHREDAIETMLMNMIYNGRIHCFQPVTWLDRKQLRLIRPLLYVAERTTHTTAKRMGFPLITNPCPAAGNTKRQHVKEMLRQLAKQDSATPRRLLTAVKHLWSPLP